MIISTEVAVDPDDGEFTATLNFKVGDALASLTFTDREDFPCLDVQVGEHVEFGRLNKSNGFDLLRVMRAAVRWCETNGLSRVYGMAADPELLVAYQKMMARYRGPIEFVLCEL